MRRKDAIEFLGLWESLNNVNFNSVEFDRIKSEAGYNSFTLSPKKWVEKNRSYRNYFKKAEDIVLANMESYNAVLISKGVNSKERMIELRKLARTQLMSLEKLNESGIKRLEERN